MKNDRNLNLNRVQKHINSKVKQLIDFMETIYDKQKGLQTLAQYNKREISIS